MWFALDQNTINALNELEKGPDRTVGVVAGAIVESYLTEILKRELTPDDSDYTKEIQNYTFQPDGPLGNFGAKIWVAYLLGYFSKKAHVDLLARHRRCFARRGRPAPGNPEATGHAQERNAPPTTGKARPVSTRTSDGISEK